MFNELGIFTHSNIITFMRLLDNYRAVVPKRIISKIP